MLSGWDYVASTGLGLLGAILGFTVGPLLWSGYTAVKAKWVGLRDWEGLSHLILGLFTGAVSAPAGALVATLWALQASRGPVWYLGGLLGWGAVAALLWVRHQNRAPATEQARKGLESCRQLVNAGKVGKAISRLKSGLTWVPKGRDQAEYAVALSYLYWREKCAGEQEMLSLLEHGTRELESVQLPAVEAASIWAALALMREKLGALDDAGVILEKHVKPLGDAPSGWADVRLALMDVARRRWSEAKERLGALASLCDADPALCIRVYRLLGDLLSACGDTAGAQSAYNALRVWRNGPTCGLPRVVLVNGGMLSLPQRNDVVESLQALELLSPGASANLLQNLDKFSSPSVEHYSCRTPTEVDVVFAYQASYRKWLLGYTRPEQSLALGSA